MPSCVVKWCKSHTDMRSIDLSFHTFPLNPVRRERWIAEVRLERQESNWMPTKNSQICSLHFRDKDRFISANGRLKLLKQTALPICTMVTPWHKKAKASTLCNTSGPSHTTNGKKMQQKSSAPKKDFAEVPIMETQTIKRELQEPDLNDTANKTNINEGTKEHDRCSFVQVKHHTMIITPLRNNEEASSDISLSSHYTNEVKMQENSSVPPKGFSEVPITTKPRTIKQELHDHNSSDVTENTNIDEGTINFEHVSCNTADVYTVPRIMSIYIKCPSCNYQFYVQSADALETRTDSPVTRQIEHQCSCHIDSAPNSPANQKLAEKLKSKTDLAKKRLHQMKTLQQQNKRLKSKNLKFKTIIENLKKCMKNM